MVLRRSQGTPLGCYGRVIRLRHAALHFCDRDYGQKKGWQIIPEPPGWMGRPGAVILEVGPATPKAKGGFLMTTRRHLQARLGLMLTG